MSLGIGDQHKDPTYLQVVGPLAPYLSYTINKHKRMTVKNLFVTNPFFNNS